MRSLIQNKHFFRETGRTCRRLGYAISLVARACPGLLAAIAVCNLTLGILPVINSVTTANILNDVAGANMTGILNQLLIKAVVLFATSTVNYGNGTLLSLAGARTSDFIRKEIIACMVTPALMAHMDDFVAYLRRNIIQPYPNVKINFATVSNFYKETVDSDFMKLEEYLEFKKTFKKARYPETISLNHLREAGELSRFLLRNDGKMEGREYACNVMKNRNVMFSPDGNAYWCLCTDQQHGAIGSYMHPTSGDTDHYMECLLRSPNRMIKCKDCLLKYVCRGGCLIYAAAQGKELKEGYCGLYENPLFWDRLEEFL